MCRIINSDAPNSDFDEMLNIWRTGKRIFVNLKNRMPNILTEYQIFGSMAKYRIHIEYSMNP